MIFTYIIHLKLHTCGDINRYHEHFGVSQTKQVESKKSKRPIDPEDIVGSISPVPKQIICDTHLFDVSFGTTDPR